MFPPALADPRAYAIARALLDGFDRHYRPAQRRGRTRPGEVWYAVGPRDVCPETFGPFLLGNPAVREVFMKHHADLLDAAFWQVHQERIAAGHVHDVFPYDPARRFVHRRAAAALAR